MTDLEQSQATANQACSNISGWVHQLQPLINKSDNDDANQLYLGLYEALIRCGQEIATCLIKSRHQAAVEELMTRNFGAGTPDEPLEGEVPKKTPKYAKDVDRVIEYYKSHHPQAKPGEKDKRLIRDRLKDGFDVEKLGRAIKGCHHSPFHCGKNDENKKYQSLELIMRDPGKVLQFIEIEEAHGGNRETPKAQAILAFGRLHKFGHRSERTDAVMAALPACPRSSPKFGTSYRKAFIDKFEEMYSD